MFIDRLQRLFGRFGGLSVFAFEIVAIFIGITGSFWVEEWREERAAYEAFDRSLEVIYYDTLRDQAWIDRQLINNNGKISLLVELVFGEPATLTDEQLGNHVGNGLASITMTPNTSGYDALMHVAPSLPFDETLQALNYAYEEGYNTVLQGLEDEVQRGAAIYQHVVDETGAISNQGFSVWDVGNTAVTTVPRLDVERNAAVRKLLVRDGVFLPHQETLGAIRRLVEGDDSRELFKRAIQSKLNQNDQLLTLRFTTQQIQEAIRTRLPDPQLPIRALGLRGSAIDGAWLETLPLQRETDEGDWWVGEVELDDGMVKFIANRDYAISWGVDPDWSVVDPYEDVTHFLGDPTTVFPKGTGAFDGQNIPVAAGRYRVRFNTKTFDYAFTALD